MNQPPLQEAYVNGRATNAWSQFFQQIFTALSGWSRSGTKSFSFDFGAVPAAGELSTTTAASGATVGATVLVAPSINTPGIMYVGIVTAANVVTVYAKNFTAAPINPAVTTFRIIILQS